MPKNKTDLFFEQVREDIKAMLMNPGWENPFTSYEGCVVCTADRRYSMVPDTGRAREAKAFITHQPPTDDGTLPPPSITNRKYILDRYFKMKDLFTIAEFNTIIDLRSL